MLIVKIYLILIGYKLNQFVLNWKKPKLNQVKAPAAFGWASLI